MDRKLTVITSALIAMLAIVAAGSGLFWDGLYKNDTRSGAAQEVGNDLVTLVLCVPLLAVTTYYAAQGSLRGRLAWTGMVFYFLYTYSMMAFMSAYNQLFLVYVAIYSLSLYAFGASLLTLDVNKVKESFPHAPVRATAAFMFAVSLLLLAMWLGTIVPSLMAGKAPALLETYTTMVIQAMDLGILVPLGIITGTLLLKRNAWGYALASVFLIKGAMYGTAVLSMALFQALNGIEVFLPFALAVSMLVVCAAALAAVFYGKMKAPAPGAA
ncbi:MAG TPA: hypothetical protein VMC61_03565 [Methanocella sp.]|nr:hypothetical protein [Methanocella sp.]